jgi:hypothetical protein
MSKLSNVVIPICPKEDIALLFSSGSSRGGNDAENKRREQILTQIHNIRSNVPEYFNDAVYGQQWTTVHEKWTNVIHQNGPNGPNGPVVPKGFSRFNVVQMAGRGHNYDFKIQYYDQNGSSIHEAHIEFKHNSKSISSIPQFLSLNINTDILAESYAGYFYDNFLSEYLACDDRFAEMNKPSKSEYVTFISRIKYDCHPLFQMMYDYEETNKAQKFDVVNRSIKQFLETHGPSIDLQKLSDKFALTQTDKTFAMWDMTDFQLFKFGEDDLLVKRFVGILNDNTILVESDTYKFKLLLRWRNHKGILNPAWQISLGDDAKNAQKQTKTKAQKEDARLEKAATALLKKQQREYRKMLKKQSEKKHAEKMAKKNKNRLTTIFENVHIPDASPSEQISEQI